MQAAARRQGSAASPIGPARGSQPGAPGWPACPGRANNGDRCKIRSGRVRWRIGRGSRAALFSRRQIRAPVRPDGHARRKTRRKSSKKCRKLAKFGAFSRAQSAISPCSEPTGADRRPLIRQALRPWSRSASSRHWPAHLQWSDIFHGLGHELTCVRPARSDDCTDFVGNVPWLCAVFTPASACPARARARPMRSCGSLSLARGSQCLPAPRLSRWLRSLVACPSHLGDFPRGLRGQASTP
jgi:hypothetical protein